MLVVSLLQHTWKKVKNNVYQPWENGVRRMWEKQPFSKVSEEGGENAPRTWAEVPLQPMEKTMATEVGHLHWGWCWSRIIHTAICGENHVEMSWEKLQPMESPCRSRILARAVALEEEPMQEIFQQELWSVRNPCHRRMLLKDNTIWKGPMLDQFFKNWSP